MAVREGWWDCPHCTTPNKGRDMSCRSCGKPRDPDIQFYLPETEPLVTDEQLLVTAKAGADWTCSFCDTDNRAALNSCRQCGATKGDSQARGMKNIPHTPKSEPSSTGPRRRGPLLLGIGILAALGLAFLAWGLFSVKDVPLVVQEAGWERSIDAEEEQLVRRTDWQDRVPGGARILRTWEEQDGTERIQVGTERVVTGKRDLGNGFFEDIVEDRPVYENRPVYRTRAEYERMEWVVVRTFATQGRSTDPLQWPVVNLGRGQREGTRTTGTFAEYRDPESGKTYTNSPPAESLGEYTPGLRVRGRINGLGVLVEVVLE